MKLLFIGDVFGKPGRKALATLLPQLRHKTGPFDFIIANCENAADGRGLTERLMQDIFSSGVDVITSGNHIWDKRDIVPLLDAETHILRPANYPPGTPGRGSAVYEKNGLRLAVINLQGRAFMPPVDCPFRSLETILEGINVPCIFVDMHAEATAEKIALARHFDGKISALAGTHTHVQTADETILPGGSAFITDAGMTGSHGGVIGMKLSSVLPKFLLGLPSRFEVDETEMRLQGVVIELDDETGRGLNVTRVNELSE